MRAQITDRDYETISAYLDGQLSPSDSRKLEERLNTRPELKQALDDMSHTRALLRAAPHRKAPRNFTLTPAMVGETMKGRSADWFTGMFPTLSFASALATLALILSLVFEQIPMQNLVSRNAQPQSGAVAMETGDNENRVMESAPAGQAADLAAPTMAAALEQPAAAESMPAAESLPAAEEPSIDAAPAEEGQMKAMGDAGAAPPVVNWGDASAQDSGNTAYAKPPMAWGMGGGGDGYYDPGQTGQVTIPLEGVESLEPEAYQADNARQTLDQPPSEITGTGPILGIPADDEAGKIQSQSGWGLPNQVLSGPAVEYQRALEHQQAQPSTEGAAPAEASPYSMPEIFGLPGLRAVQGLLALLAIGLAAAAVFAWRKSRGL
jgi:anti-sigma factor RsiW